MPTALKCHVDPFLLAIPFWKVPIYTNMLQPNTTIRVHDISIMSLYGDIKGTHTCNKWQVDIVTSASEQGERCLYRGFSWVLPMKSWMAYRDCFHVISFQDPLSFPKIVQQPKRSKKQSQYVTILYLPLFLCILPYHCANITPITMRL